MFNFIHDKLENHFLNCDSELVHDFFTSAVNGDGSVIVSSGLSDGAHVWSTSNSKWKHEKITCVMTASDKSSHGITFMRISMAGNRIVTDGHGSEVRVFDKETASSFNHCWKQKHVGQHNNGIYTVTIRGDGNQLVCLLFDGSIHLWTYLKL